MREERKRFSLPPLLLCDLESRIVYRPQSAQIPDKRAHRRATKNTTDQGWSTRAGGGGRTTVTAALAEVAIRQGKKVALLSYRFRPAFLTLLSRESILLKGGGDGAMTR